MYAAAAGASLGSRQARKQQRLQNTKNAAALQQTLKDKLAASKALQTPTKSRQFHQLPANYLRTPAAHTAAHRKASIGQHSTSNSRLLLPSSVASSTRNIHLQFEQQQQLRGQLKSPHHHHSRHASFHTKSRSRSSSRDHHSSRQHHHHSRSQLEDQHPHYHLNPNPDCVVHGSCSQLLVPSQRLNRSATATLPLNDYDQSPPSTPLLLPRHRHHNHRHLDPSIASNSHLLAPLLGGSQSRSPTHHRNSFSTLYLDTGQDHQHQHHHLPQHPHQHQFHHLLPEDSLAVGGGPLSRRTSEVDFKRGTYHPIEPIIITPATPLPSPHRHQQQQTQEEDAAAEAGGAEDEEQNEQQDQDEVGAVGLLIDLRPAHDKSTDNLSRCESPTEPPTQPLERKCSVYRARPGPEQKYYYYDDESKLNENDTYYDSYSRTIRYELDPGGGHRVLDSGTYDLMVPTMTGNSWISPEFLTNEGIRGVGGRKPSTAQLCTCDHVEVIVPGTRHGMSCICRVAVYLLSPEMSILFVFVKCSAKLKIRCRRLVVFRGCFLVVVDAVALGQCTVNSTVTSTTNERQLMVVVCGCLVW